MSAPTTSDFGDYSKLIDEDGLYDNFRPEQSRRVPPSAPQGGPAQRPGPSPGPSPGLGLRQGPGLYRVLTLALAALCVILLICVIAMSTRKSSDQKNEAREGDLTPQTEKQKHNFNISELVSTISKLQEENKQLWAKVNATKVVLPSLPSLPPKCPTGWLRFGSSCYLISSQYKSWTAGHSFCENLGAHLAIVLTPEEQTFLWDLLPRGHWNCFWIGITDSHTEDQWKWVDGTPLVGGFWEEGEPNNHINEDCGYILKTDVLTRVAIRSWYDAPCSMSLPFICEKEDPAAATTKRPN